MIKSDLAFELNPTEDNGTEEDIAIYKVKVDEALSKKIGKPIGLYITIDSRIVVNNERENYSRLFCEIANQLRNFVLRNAEKILIVGLGNRLLTADALGCKTVDKILGGHSGKCEILTLCPGVYGVTAIESYDVVRGVVGVIKPSLVIAVDSLCAAKTARIGASFQITDAGIIPGSGVKNARKALNRQSLGVGVVSIGLPTVVYASTIARECGGEDCDELEQMVVTAKDIDTLVENGAEVIAGAINHLFCNR